MRRRSPQRPCPRARASKDAQPGSNRAQALLDGLAHAQTAPRSAQIAEWCARKDLCNNPCAVIHNREQQPRRAAVPSGATGAPPSRGPHRGLPAGRPATHRPGKASAARPRTRGGSVAAGCAPSGPSQRRGALAKSLWQGRVAGRCPPRSGPAPATATAAARPARRPAGGRRRRRAGRRRRPTAARSPRSNRTGCAGRRCSGPCPRSRPSATCWDPSPRTRSTCGRTASAASWPACRPPPPRPAAAALPGQGRRRHRRRRRAGC